MTWETTLDSKTYTSFIFGPLYSKYFAADFGILDVSSEPLKFERYDIADTLIYFEDTGVDVVRVVWREPFVDGEGYPEHTLYYGLNHNIASDPAVDADTIISDATPSGLGATYILYDIEYKSNEKTALLNQYKRYGSASGEYSTVAGTIDATIGDIIASAMGTVISTEPEMNFKKSQQPPFTPQELTTFSSTEFGQPTDLYDTTQSTPVASSAPMSSGGPKGGY